MLYKRIAFIIAGLFFCFWLTVLYAGADHPPPPGFFGVVILDLICALLVCWRVPSYVVWSRERRKGRFWRALVDGLAAGLMAALVAMIFKTGEADVQPVALDRVLWFAVVGAVGIVNSGSIYLITALVARRSVAH